MIKEILEKYKFKDIALYNNQLEFKKGKRTFFIDLLTKEILTDFNIEDFIKNNYKKKERLSISFENALESEGVEEEAFKKLKWKLVKGPYSSEEFDIKNIYFSTVSEVKIGEFPHIVIDSEVYSGKIDDIIFLLSINPRSLLPSEMVNYLDL